MQEVSEATFPKVRLYLTLFLGFVECLFYGATLTGWASIVYVFKEDGVFSHLCDNEEAVSNQSSVLTTVSSATFPATYEATTVNATGFPSCSAQDRMFSLVFTIAVLFWGAVGIPLGWFFDKYGILKTRIIAVICGIIGYLMMALAGSDAYTSYLIFPASLFQVVSCFLTITTCSYMAQLAGPHASTVSALCVGAANTSVVIFLVVKNLHNNGISRHTSLSVVAGYWLVVLLYSFFIMPHHKVVMKISSRDKDYIDDNMQNIEISSYLSEGESAVHFHKQTNDNKVIVNASKKSEKDVEPNSQESGESDLNVPIKFDTQTNDNKAMVNASKPPEKDIPTLWQCMKTWTYLSLSFWFLIIFLAYHTFLGTYNPWVTKVAEGDNDTVDHLTNVLAYCQLSALLISLIPGVVTDFVKTKIEDHGDMTQGVATVPILFINTTLAIILNICVVVNKASVVSFSAIVSEFTRTFLFSITLAFIALSFPGEHYGKLFGITYFIGGLFNLLQYPLFIWADSSNSYFGMSLILVILTILAFCHPIYMIIYRIRGSKKTTKKIFLGNMTYYSEISET